MSEQKPALLRPIGASLLAAALLLAGILALHKLGVTALPLAPVPRIYVSVNQSGASSSVLASSVIAPLERHLGRIAGLHEMYSSSRSGRGFIQLSFVSSMDMNRAFREVEATVREATPDLPAGLEQPLVQKTTTDTIPAVSLVMTSELQAPGSLIDTATTRAVPILAAIKGVSGVTVFGVEPDAMIIDLDLSKLAAVGLTSNDVSDVVAAANHPSALGSLDDGHTRLLIYEPKSWVTASDIGNTVLLNRAGSSVRLSEVARVWRAPRDENNISSYDGAPAVILQIFKLPEPDALEIDRDISRQFTRIQLAFPAGAKILKSFSAAPATETAIADAAATLVMSCILVALACAFFLRNARVTFAATLAIPLALAGTLLALLAFGYTLNLLTLLALTIGVGFIVDDAVIVTESIARHIEAGIVPAEAAARTARELRFTIISITCSLICAFIPLLFGSDAGLQMFRSSSMTLVACVIISAAVALLLIPGFRVPAAAKSSYEGGNGSEEAYVHRHPELPKPTEFLRYYATVLDFIIRHRRIVGWLPVLLVVATFGTYKAVAASTGVGFMPAEDTRLLQVSIDYDPAISAAERARRLALIDDVVRRDPAVSHAAAMSGTWGSAINVELSRGPDKHSSDETPINGVVRRLVAATRAIPGVAVGFFPVNYLGTSQGAGQNLPGRVSTFDLVSQNGTALRPWVMALATALEHRFGRGSVSTEYDRAAIEQAVDIDRDKASRLGIGMGDIDAALNRSFADSIVASLKEHDQAVGVILRASPEQRTSLSSLLSVNVRTSSGAMIPLSAIATIRSALSPVEIRHQNQLETATIGFREPPGVDGAQFAEAIREALYAIHAPGGIVPKFGDEVSTPMQCPRARLR